MLSAATSKLARPEGVTAVNDGGQAPARIISVGFCKTGGTTGLTLASAPQAEIASLLDTIARRTDDGHPFRLELRQGGGVGANALALPSGVIIVTDELVALARHDEELTAVLAHEVGHVTNRHSMRLLLQSSATALLIATLTGDITSLTALAASIPTVLVQTGYSRQFEREADDYAYDYLAAAGIPPRRFGDSLTRLEDTRRRRRRLPLDPSTDRRENPRIEIARA